jgi:hypothetical protein
MVWDPDGLDRLFCYAQVDAPCRIYRNTALDAQQHMHDRRTIQHETKIRISGPICAILPSSFNAIGETYLGKFTPIDALVVT